MRPPFALGILFAFAAGPALAGTATGQFGVQITLNGANSGAVATNASGSSCTSSSGSGSSSASVKVQCTPNVFAIITRVNPAKTPQFITSFRPARDSALPDYCRNEQPGLAGQMARIACPIDELPNQVSDSDLEDGGGWNVEGRLYALEGNSPAAHAQTLAQLQLKNAQGTLTALYVDRTKNQFETVEMLVSF
jgi:hypothetical protein